MIDVLLVIAGLIMLAALLFSEKQGSPRSILVTKTILSCLFVLTALLRPHPIPGYFYLLLVGLILCLIGDVCLALPQEKAFLAGLAAFLLGHVFYIFSFLYVGQLALWPSWPALAAVAASVLAFIWLRPHLGSMLWPVVAYILVITAMVCGAWAVYKGSGFSIPGGLFIFGGAVLFYLSDLFVARNRFVKDELLNRLVGLPLYYGGQFLLAFSAGLLSRPGGF